MSETIEATPSAEAAKPRGRGRRIAWISGGAALVLVAAGLVVPHVVQAQRVSTYAALADEYGDAVLAQSTAQKSLDAAAALTRAQQDELAAFGARLLVVGQTAEPVLAAAHTEEITASANTLLGTVGEPAASDEFADAVTDADADADADAATENQDAAAPSPLLVAVEQLQADDAAARQAAEEAGEEAPVPTAPSSYLALSTADAVSIIDDTTSPQALTAVADDAVTDDLIDETRQQLAATQTETARLQRLIRDEESRMAEFSAAITATLPALQSAAQSAATQVTQVVETAPKAPDVAATAVAAAQKVNEVAEVEDAARIVNELEAYIAAASAAQAEHAAVVQREQEAAAAAARAAASRSAANNRGGGGGGGGSRLCSRFRPSPGGGGSLVLVYC